MTSKSDPAHRGRRSFTWPDLLAGNAVVAFGVALLALNWIRIEPRADDPTFLGWIAAGTPAPADWGPLYVSFLKLLVELSGVPLLGYKLTFGALALVNALLVFGWLRVRRISPANAFLASCFFSLSGLSVFGALSAQPPSSISGNAALCMVLLAGIAHEARFRDRGTSYAMVSLGLFLATYCRPEFLLGAVAFGGAAIVFAVRQSFRQGSFTAAGATAIVAIVAAVLTACWQLPVPSASRAFLAFGQHLGLSYCSFHPDQCLTASVWSDWQHYVDSLVPGSRSIGEAVRQHPAEVLAHILRNVRLTIMAIGWVFLTIPALQLPQMWSVLLGTLLFAAVTVLFILALRRSGRRWTLVPNLADYVFLLVVAGSQIADWVLLFPRIHYLVVPLTILAVMAAAPRSAMRVLGDGQSRATNYTSPLAMQSSGGIESQNPRVGQNACVTGSECVA